MRKKGVKWVWAILALFMVIVLSGATVLAQEVTILGTINEDYQIIDEQGQVYNLAENDAGIEVGSNFNERVRVTGTVQEVEGQRTITVTSYEVLAE